MFLFTNAEFLAWREIVLRDPEIYEADVNDAMLILGTARLIWNKHPEYRDALERFADQCIQEAFTELGMYMGCMNLCRKIGFNTELGQQYMESLFGNDLPQLEP